MKIRIIFITIIMLASSLIAEAQQNTEIADGLIVRRSAAMAKGGDQMVVNISLDILEDFKIKGEKYARLTPMIQNDSTSMELPPIIISGKRQNIIYERQVEEKLNAKGIEPLYIVREKGTRQTVKYTAAVPYQKWMAPCELSLDEDLCGCRGIAANKSEKVLAYYYNLEPVMAYLTPEAEPVKHRADSSTAFLDFPVNETVIYSDYRNNPLELYKIMQTIDVVRKDPNTSITRITIHGYASPEGSYNNNIRLAKGRTEALKQHVRDLYRFDESLISTDYTPEDWEGLRKYVAESGMAEKMELLAIIDSGMDPDEKNAELQKYKGGHAYKHLLKSVYPALRHSDYAIWYTVRNFTVEEAREIIKKNPKLLSLNEMFLVANSYEKGSQEYKDVFETAVQMFPDNETANLNAACIALEEGRTERAARYLAKAGEKPEVIHAKGVLAMIEGDFILAKDLLAEAEKAGLAEAAYNLRQLEKKLSEIASETK